MVYQVNQPRISQRERGFLVKNRSFYQLTQKLYGRFSSLIDCISYERSARTSFNT